MCGHLLSLFESGMPQLLQRKQFSVRLNANKEEEDKRVSHNWANKKKLKKKKNMVQKTNYTRHPVKLSKSSPKPESS